MGLSANAAGAGLAVGAAVLAVAAL